MHRSSVERKSQECVNMSWELRKSGICAEPAFGVPVIIRPPGLAQLLFFWGLPTLGPALKKQQQQREEKETASKAGNSPTPLHPLGQPEGRGGAGLWLTAVGEILNQTRLNTRKVYVVIKIRPLLYLKRAISARAVCGVCFCWRGQGNHRARWRTGSHRHVL